ncbi:hypothetical protein FN846DRAFT_933981 [Sphaerosporella brunnea]|uniref:Uncharacterized protein n=1 Tax=Sphaerosporella brunnea TaxID=1250544 RepID=A0A5J5F5U3_9PEZI|nr:hypothetical protein FN846DRAFT_933981 [Sphaerosporella brunnea]
MSVIPESPELRDCRRRWCLVPWECGRRGSMVSVRSVALLGLLLLLLLALCRVIGGLGDVLQLAGALGVDDDGDLGSAYGGGGAGGGDGMMIAGGWLVTPLFICGFAICFSVRQRMLGPALPPL